MFGGFQVTGIKSSFCCKKWLLWRAKGSTLDIEKLNWEKKGIKKTSSYHEVKKDLSPAIEPINAGPITRIHTSVPRPVLGLLRTIMLPFQVLHEESQ